jgi:hypothetical protein
MGVWWWWV